VVSPEVPLRLSLTAGEARNDRLDDL